MSLIMNLRNELAKAFTLTEPAQKVAAMKSLWAARPVWRVLSEDCIEPQPMGRPLRPVLRPPKEVPSRKPSTPEGLAALIHSVCHIEFNAINLALDAGWRFADMPERYYLDWAKVAYEESLHFEMLSTLLLQMGYTYGDFDAHEGLWQMCERTQDDLLARMALVPRTLEARGLDATPLIQEKLRTLRGPLEDHAKKALDILDIILRDEITHVQIGNHWYLWLCAQAQLDPQACYAELTLKHRAPKIRPPFNEEARRLAGFNEADLVALNAFGKDLER
jgi:uncharacterized ferritin-like protein (DUF455 family)